MRVLKYADCLMAALAWMVKTLFSGPIMKLNCFEARMLIFVRGGGVVCELQAYSGSHSLSDCILLSMRILSNVSSLFK